MSFWEFRRSWISTLKDLTNLYLLFWLSCYRLYQYFWFSYWFFSYYIFVLWSFFARRVFLFWRPCYGTFEYFISLFDTFCFINCVAFYKKKFCYFDAHAMDCSHSPEFSRWTYWLPPTDCPQWMGDKTVTRLWNVFKVSQEILFHWLKDVKYLYKTNKIWNISTFSSRLPTIDGRIDFESHLAEGRRQMCNRPGLIAPSSSSKLLPVVFFVAFGLLIEKTVEFFDICLILKCL